MKNTNHHLIQIYEHQRLRIGETYDGVMFSKQHWEQLLQFHENQYPPYFQIIHQGIKALHYVGSIHLPALTLEILPKTDSGAHINWQRFLLDMLYACGKLPAPVSSALLTARKTKMQDLFILAFIREVESLCKAGLIKKYRREKRNEHKFSGKILLHEHIRRNVVHKERVYSEHQVYDIQHLLHAILQEALRMAWQVSDAPELRARIQQSVANFSTSNAKFDLSLLKRWKPAREDACYEQALQWANLILQHFGPQLKYGDLPSACFMMDMQQLFEDYVSLQLKKAAPKYGCRVQQQLRSRFWKQRSIRPDMVLTTPDGASIIMDTKWKKLHNVQPDDVDLKQIYIYNQFFNANRGILIYPDQQGARNYAAAYVPTRSSAISCELHFIQLLDRQQHSLSAAWTEGFFESLLSTENYHS